MTPPDLPGKARQPRFSWLSFALISTLLFLSSCAPLASSTQTQVTATPAIKVKPAPTKTTSTTSTSTGDTTQSLRDTIANLTLLHRLEGLQGWMWRANLPANRLVIYYGNPFSSAMGPIGAYSDDELIARLN